MRHTCSWALVPVISIGLGGTALADDYPNHAGTNGIIYPGQSVYGTLENGSDQDWFAIDLQAGMSVTLDLEGQRTKPMGWESAEVAKAEIERAIGLFRDRFGLKEL